MKFNFYAPVAFAVAFLMAAGEARGLTPVGPPLEALAAPSRADVSLMVAESTVFCRRKKLVGGGTADETWLEAVGVTDVEARLPADDGVVAVVPLALAAAAPAPEALALAAASRVSPPDDARRPPGLDDVAEMERWTLR